MCVSVSGGPVRLLKEPTPLWSSVPVNSSSTSLHTTSPSLSYLKQQPHTMEIRPCDLRSGVSPVEGPQSAQCSLLLLLPPTDPRPFQACPSAPQPKDPLPIPRVNSQHEPTRLDSNVETNQKLEEKLKTTTPQAGTGRQSFYQDGGQDLPKVCHGSPASEIGQMKGIPVLQDSGSVSCISGSF